MGMKAGSCQDAIGETLMEVNRRLRARSVDAGRYQPVDINCTLQQPRWITIVQLQMAVCVYPTHAPWTLDGTPGNRSVVSFKVDSGITRKIDDLGRIVIPAETRRMFNIREGDHLYVAVEGGNIVLRKMTDSCTFCGSDERVTQFKGKGICAGCRSQLDS